MGEGSECGCYGFDSLAVILVSDVMPVNDIMKNNQSAPRVWLHRERAGVAG